MKELSMRYSFRNTLCGLAVIAAAGLIAEQAKAQGTVTLLEDDDAISFSSDIDFSVPEEISLFDDQSSDISLGGGLISPAQAEARVSVDIIPMEVTSPFPSGASVNFDDSNLNTEVNNTPNMPLGATAPVKAKSTTPPAALMAPEVTGRLLSAQSTQGFDESIAPSINNELFMKMSDLERQTTLLNLELKKERVQNEIASVKAQRLKAQQEEEAKAREIERQRIEWENEQARLMVEEQRKLKESAIALEKLRQEKIVREYKATMLDNIQKWIKRNAEVYAKLAEKDAENKKLMEDTKAKMAMVMQRAQELKTRATAAKTNYDKKVIGLEDQISILKARLEAEIESSKKKVAAVSATTGGKRNPFAIDGTSAPLTKDKVKLSKEYAIMEIVGQGDELAAKLINYDGNVFLAKIGTTLQNGYTIDEITQTYLSAVKDNDRDFLYFSAGGILDREPPTPEVTLKAPEAENNSSGSNASNGYMRGTINSTQGIPSLSRGMVIR